MKQKMSEWSQCYLAALQKHLKEGSRTSRQTARALGRQALASGLYKLDVAMLHTQALVKLVAPHYSAGTKEEMFRRAERFFVEVTSPIEKTHRRAMNARVQLDQLNQTLRERTEELAVAKRQLKREMVRRQAAEAALQKAGRPQNQLLEQPRPRQIQLRPPPPQMDQTREIRS